MQRSALRSGSSLKRVVRLLATLPLALMTVPSSAGAPMGYRNILDFGCHKNDGTCYVNQPMFPTFGYGSIEN